jgi:hypothetical protein
MANNNPATTTTTTDNKPAAKVYSTAKITAAIEGARNEVKAVIDQCVADRNFGKSSPLKDLSTVDTWLQETLAKLANVGKPRVKKERKAKK